jgi:gamma-glutamyltranspeptidase/glutathione hydrolase
VLVTGSPGGRTIINTVFGIVLGVTEFGLTGREAVDAPRMHHQWMPDSVSFEQDAIPPEVAGRLREMGHVVKVQGRQGDAHSIWIDPKSGIAYGVNDRRSADSKASK